MDWIIEPLIGAWIGLITSFFAIIMMFRIIKKKNIEISKAIIQYAKENLLSSENILEIASSDVVVNRLQSAIYNYVVKIDNTQFEGIEEFSGDMLEKLHIEIIVAQEVNKYITEKVSTNLILSKVLNGRIKEEICEYVKKRVADYVKTDGRKKVANLVRAEVESISDNSVKEIFDKYDVDNNKFEIAFKQKYIELVRENSKALVDSIDIEKIVENKVSNIPKGELSKIVKKIIRKDLILIVILGTILGFLIGLAGGRL